MKLLWPTTYVFPTFGAFIQNVIKCSASFQLPYGIGENIPACFHALRERAPFYKRLFSQHFQVVTLLFFLPSPCFPTIIFIKRQCAYSWKVITIERNTDVSIKCFKCGNSYTMDQMRMDPKSPNLTCRNCLERKTPVKSAPMPKDPYAPLDAPSKKSSEKTSYFCKACRYNFTRAAHIPISTCPYCSASGS